MLRKKTEICDIGFYKKSLLYCISFVKGTGGNEDDAREVLQDSLERFLIKINDKNYIVKHEPKQLLYGIIRNTWKEYKRNKNTYLEDSALPEELIDDGNILISEKLRMDIYHEIFSRCIQFLSEDCKKAFKLQEKGFSLEKIAGILNANNSKNMKYRLYRCREKLRMIMNEDKAYIELLKDG